MHLLISSLAIVDDLAVGQFEMLTGTQNLLSQAGLNFFIQESSADS